MDDERKKGRERLIGNEGNFKDFSVSLGIVSSFVVVGEEGEMRTEAARDFWNWRFEWWRPERLAVLR
jgi:hypothetical protein